MEKKWIPLPSGDYDLELMQNLIGDEGYSYEGTDPAIAKVVQAIKAGYRLANLAEVDRKICDAFDDGFDQGIHALK